MKKILFPSVMLIAIATIFSCRNETARRNKENIVGKWVYEKGRREYKQENIVKLHESMDKLYGKSDTCSYLDEIPIFEPEEYSMEERLDTLYFYSNGKYQELQVNDEEFGCFVSLNEGTYSIDDKVITINSDFDKYVDSIIELTPTKFVYVRNYLFERCIYTMKKVQNGKTETTSP